jgi:hypothetical protein
VIVKSKGGNGWQNLRGIKRIEMAGMIGKPQAKIGAKLGVVNTLMTA